MLILNVYAPVHERTVTKKDGTEFKIRFQEGEMLQENRRPRVVEIPVPGEGHYNEGLYTAAAESFRPNNYERLEMKFLTLIPLEEALKLGEKQSKIRKGEKLT